MPLAGWREGEVWVSCQVGDQRRRIGFCTSCLCSWPEWLWPPAGRRQRRAALPSALRRQGVCPDLGGPRDLSRPVLPLPWSLWTPAVLEQAGGALRLSAKPEWGREESSCRKYRHFMWVYCCTFIKGATGYVEMDCIYIVTEYCHTVYLYSISSRCLMSGLFSKQTVTAACSLSCLLLSI